MIMLLRIGLFSLSVGSVISMNAIDKLSRCCQLTPGIDQYCANKYCQFPHIAPFMVFPFIAECAPRGSTVSKIWDCISSKHNHMECCRNQGVWPPMCLDYCNAEQPVPTDMIKYGPCVSQFDKYRVCFRTYLKNNPSIIGDI